MIDQGVDIQNVAALAGHESIETTRRYTTPSEKELRKAVELITGKSEISPKTAKLRETYFLNT